MAEGNSNLAKVAAKLKQIREREDLKLRPTKHLKETFTDFDGTERELRVRYYQVQGILHLVFMKRFLLGDDTGLGKCNDFNTLVNTDQGLLRMGEIEDWAGMEAGSFRPMSRDVGVLVNGKRCPIKNFYYGGVKPTVTVTTRYGFSVTGTKVHPLLVLREGERQWVQAQHLREGDYLCVHRTEDVFPTTEPPLASGGPLPKMTPAFGRFLGYYIGEGSLTARGGVVVSQCPEANPEPHADIVRLFAECFNKTPKHPESCDLRLYDTHLRRWLADNGLGYCSSKDRVVPPCILQATEESSREFLRALFEGEGHVSKSHIEYSTASEELGRQVQIMLLRFGIVARRAPKYVKKYPDNTYWRLTICGQDAELFQSRLGFISTRKQEALRACLDRSRNTNHDVVPEVQQVFEQVRDELKAAVTRTGANKTRKGSGIKQFGNLLVNTLNNIRNYGRNPSYPFIQRVAGLLREHAPDSDALKVLEDFLSTNYFYDPVVTLDEGEDEVFDIEVDDPEHCFVGNGLINHNTLQSIAALCYVWEKDPGCKAIVLTTKSATPQWAKEFGKFTKGVRVIVAKGTRKQREKAYETWRKSDKPTVMVMGYRSAVNDIRKLQDDEGYILITDEATAYKNPKTQVHQVIRYMSGQADRIWALTATLIKNNLMEGHGIYSVVAPGLFGSINNFMYYYCIVEMMQIGRGRKVPRIVGYHPEKVSEFREKIEPYYLGRPKHAVAKELPTLVREVFEVGMSRVQQAKYKEALSGLLEVGEKRSGGAEEKEVTKLTALIYCQQIANHPELIECEGDSEKLKALIDMLTDGDLTGEKVIIFTRFKKMVDLLMPALKKAGLDPRRVTGDETEDQRQAAQDAFQDPNHSCKAICITSAGGEGINLQAAKAIIFYDTPWSAGEYLQVLGRMIRIGSVHDSVLAIHLVATFKGGQSIDKRVMDVIQSKMKLIEAVLGERLKGKTNKSKTIEVSSEINDIFDAMQEDARGQ